MDNKTAFGYCLGHDIVYNKVCYELKCMIESNRISKSNLVDYLATLEIEHKAWHDEVVSFNEKEKEEEE